MKDSVHYMSEKQAEFTHQYYHACLHNALKVHVVRDDRGDPVEFQDVEPHLYHLFRGAEHGEGHADRLLDDYIGRTKLGAELPPCGCAEYRRYLDNERKYGGAKAPKLSLRARLQNGAHGCA